MVSGLEKYIEIGGVGEGTNQAADLAAFLFIACSKCSISVQYTRARIGDLIPDFLFFIGSAKSAKSQTKLERS